PTLQAKSPEDWPAAAVMTPEAPASRPAPTAPETDPPLAARASGDAEADPSPAASAPGAVHWALPEELRAARRTLERSHAVLRGDPDHVAALRDQLAALVALQRWSEAADTLGRLVQLRPDEAALPFEHGTMLMQARRWSDAIPVLRGIVAREPEHGRAWFNLATAHQALGHLGEALAAWNRTLTLTPETGGPAAERAAYAARGEVLLDLGDWDAAAADFERVLAAEPDATDALLNLALARQRGGRPEEARGVLAERAARDPRNLAVLTRLAQMAWEACLAASDGAATTDTHTRSAGAGLCVEALDWCERGLAVDPGNRELRALREAIEGERPASPDR
ncbi:MAG: tetratricopeptide repeat protein, partial [Planctomycetota bacterium]